MAFVDRDKILKATVERAEKEVNDALEKERPDELGKPKPGETAEPVKEPEKALGDSEEMTWKDRYGNLQRHIEKNIKPKFQSQIDVLAQEVKSFKEQLATTTAKAAPAALPETDQELEALKNQNPGAYNAIVKLASNIADEIVTRKTKDLSATVDRIQKDEKRVSEEAAFVELAKRHPNLDVFNLDADERFVEWFDKQPKRVQALLTDQKEDVDAASTVLKMFERDLGIGAVKKADKQPERKAASKEVDVSGTPNIPQPPVGYEFTESQIDEMDRVNPRWFDENSEKIEKAMREGRILLDITDPAGTARRLASRAA